MLPTTNGIDELAIRQVMLLMQSLLQVHCLIGLSSKTQQYARRYGGHRVALIRRDL